MPSLEGQGMSDSTKVKAQMFAGIMGFHAAVVTGILRRTTYTRNQYLYVDANSGQGINALSDGSRIYGSPVIAAAMLKKAGCGYRGYCIDGNRLSAVRLQEILSWASSFSVINGDNCNSIRKIADELRAEPDKLKSYGMVYCDPNGIEVPVDSLSYFFRDSRMSSTDLLINIPTASFKRAQYAFKDKEGRIQEDFAGFICRLSEAVNKKHIRIRVPSPGRHQWTMVLMTNWEGWPDMSDMGFYPLTSPPGQQVLFAVNSTGREKEVRGWTPPDWFLSRQERYRSMMGQQFKDMMGIQLELEGFGFE